MDKKKKVLVDEGNKPIIDEGYQPKQDIEIKPPKGGSGQSDKDVKEQE